MAEEERESFKRVLDWIDGKDDGVDRTYNYPEEGTKWYIVSSKWLNNWKITNKLIDDVLSDEPKPLSEIDSEDIILTDPSHHLPNNFILKPSAKLGVDYEILPKKAWKFLKQKYSFKHKIKRQSISINNDSTFIEISLFRVRCLFVLDKKLKFDDIHTFYFSKSDSINNVIEKLSSFIMKSNSSQDYWTHKLWKLSVNEILGRPENSQGSDDNTQCEPTKAEIQERDEKAVENLKALVESYKYYSLVFPGQLIERSINKIAESDFADNEIFLLEIRKGYMGSELFKEKPKKQCEFCRKQEAKARQCFCKKFFYCDDECEDRDRNYHCCRKIIKNFVKTDQSRMGIVGLQNLGNTCYMNSGLQCLSHTQPLTNYILGDHYQNDVNPDNLLGSKGAELINEYVGLIKEMWYGTSSRVSPWGVKKAFGDFANQFLGFFQQDSQEMLGYLIDGIHEDLNRVKKKPYLEDPSANNISEDEFASLLWTNHKLRNDSIIVDLMHGQYRSEIECPDCAKVSITFDPFLMLTLPIPERKIKEYEFIFVDSLKCVNGVVSLPKGMKAGQIKEKVCEILKISNNTPITMAEMSSNNLKSILNPSDEIHKKMKLILYTNLDSTSMDLDDNITIFLDFRKKSYGYSGTILGPPFILTTSKEIQIEDLYKEVFILINKLKNSENDSEEEFRKNFPSFFGRTHYSDNDNMFSLKVHNPFQFPCCICDRVACAGCSIQNKPVKLSYYLCHLKENNLRISVIFSERLYDFSFIPSIKDYKEPTDYNMRQKTVENVQLDECFELFLRREQLDENNTVYCSQCKDHKKGFKKMGIKKLPQILIIHLKRFKQKNKYVSSKNGKLVHFPMEGLDMSKYSIGDGGIYDLYAVSNHYGSLEGGHYTAYAKDVDGLWRDYDDSSVGLVSNPEETVVREAAYVLFYKRR